MHKRENTTPERLFRRLWHILRWPNITLASPAPVVKAKPVSLSLAGRKADVPTAALAATSSLTLTEDAIRGGTIAPLNNHNRRLLSKPVTHPAPPLESAFLERQLDRMNSTTSRVWSTSCTLEDAQFPFDLVLPCPISGFRSEVTKC